MCPREACHVTDCIVSPEKHNMLAALGRNASELLTAKLIEMREAGADKPKAAACNVKP